MTYTKDEMTRMQIGMRVCIYYLSVLYIIRLLCCCSYDVFHFLRCCCCFSLVSVCVYFFFLPFFRPIFLQFSVEIALIQLGGCCRCGCFCFAFLFCCLLLDIHCMIFCLRLHWIFITFHSVGMNHGQRDACIYALVVLGLK